MSRAEHTEHTGAHHPADRAGRVASVGTRRRRVMTGLVPAALGVGIAMALTGCGAGQITQTDTQQAAINGASGMAGPIAIRNAELAFPRNAQGVYQPGQSATLIVTIVNTGLTADQLVKVSSPAASGATIDGSASGSKDIPGNFAIQSGSDVDDHGATGASVSESPSATPTSNPPSAGQLPGGGAGQSSATSSANPSAGASVLPSSPPGTVTIVLTGLKSINGAPLRSGLTIPITFFFAHAGQATLNTVPVAAPADGVVSNTPTSAANNG